MTYAMSSKFQLSLLRPWGESYTELHWLPDPSKIFSAFMCRFHQDRIPLFWWGTAAIIELYSFYFRWEQLHLDRCTEVWFPTVVNLMTYELGNIKILLWQSMDGIQNWRRQVHSFIDYLYNEKALYSVEVRNTTKD